VPPYHTLYTDPEQTARMLALLRCPLEHCHEVPMNRAERKELLHTLLQFYQLQLPGFSQINTPEILEMVM